MQQKTSSSEFERYGTIYKEPVKLQGPDVISREWHVDAENTISQLYRFDCPVYLEMQSGMAMILVGETAKTEELQLFAIHRMVELKPGICFALVAVTPSISCKMLTSERYTCDVERVKPPYQYKRILPQVRIPEILGYYYSVRNTGYVFDGESHGYYELTYVDLGSMITTVDGVSYQLKERDLMIYGPSQFHTQRVDCEGLCSYVTIIFEMKNTGYESLLNKVFSYDKKIYTLIKTFILESSEKRPYADSLLLCLLQETIIRLLQKDYISGRNERLISDARQHYQDQLLEKILAYIDENICKPLTIAEICQKFSLSRSSLQILFKENMNQSPKRYISDLKMEKSRQMICEDKYTISEIALMMGFNSIHYFSRAFTQKYQIAPSEYSKTIFRA